MQAARRTTSLTALATRFPPARPELPTRATDPVDILASMLDLRGSVQLSELLDQMGPALVSEEGESSLPSDLVEELEKRVVATMQETATAFESLRRPLRVLRALRAESDLEAGARALTERFEEALARAIAKGRADVRLLRDELGETLKKASLRARALERLDAAVVLSTRGAVSTRLLTVIPAAATAFETQVTDRLLSAGTIDLAKVESFCRPEGWLGRAVAEGEATAIAVVRMESGLLLALAEAAAR